METLLPCGNFHLLRFLTNLWKMTPNPYVSVYFQIIQFLAVAMWGSRFALVVLFLMLQFWELFSLDRFFFFYLGVSENFELWLQNIFDNVIYFYERIDFMKVIYVIQCNLMYYLFQVAWANLVNLNKKKRWVWSRPRKNFWPTCTHYPINTWKHRY